VNGAAERLGHTASFGTEGVHSCQTRSRGDA
jgi:hypothetical protein